jgi:type IV secretion system protein VirB10
MTGAGPVEASQPPKQDPGPLELRGRPRPSIRFRRGLIIGLAAAALGALALLSLLALRPVSFEPSRGTLSEAASGAAPEAVAGAPSTYSDVPLLGPPLPGDLGRGIVERRRQSEEPRDAESAESEGEAEMRQRLARERQAALRSPVLARLSWSGPKGRADPAPRRGRSDSAATAAGSSPTPGRESGAAAGGEGRSAVLEGQASPWTLVAGTVIPASLLTGLNSDLPGMVVAQVTENVRDSATGRTVLIPQGSRLVGDYDSHVGFGQQRVLLVWNRLLLPDGSSVDLGEMPATDASGHSGLADGVDLHEWRLAKGVVLSSLLGIGSELGLGGEDPALVRALRDSAQSSGTRAGEAIVSRELEVKPTLTVRPGWPVRAVLRRDLVLRPWRGW